MTPALEELFRKVARQYKSLKRRCEARVIRWEWASGVRYTSEPYFFERNRIPRGRTLKNKPKMLGDPYGYGFDRKGQLVVARGVNLPNEEFFVYSPNEVVGAYFDHDPGKPLVKVTRQRFARGRIVATEWAAMEAHGAESYRYVGVRLTSIHGWSRDSSRRKEVYRCELSFDDMGNLVKIVQYDPSVRRGSGRVSRTLLFQRPPQQMSFKALAHEVEVLLLRLIPEKIRQARISERAYCLTLYYCWAGRDVLPPYLGIGLEKERDSIVSRQGNLWTPRVRVELGAKALGRVGEILNQRILMEERDSFVPRFLNSIALRLARRKWNGILKTTPEFVVYAVDHDNSDVSEAVRSIKGTSSRKTLARLTTRGYV